jgi:hypothetical protein
MAATLFAEPPSASLEEALDHFLAGIFGHFSTFLVLGYYREIDLRCETLRCNSSARNMSRHSFLRNFEMFFWEKWTSSYITM